MEERRTIIRKDIHLNTITMLVVIDWNDMNRIESNPFIMLSYYHVLVKAPMVV